MNNIAVIVPPNPSFRNSNSRKKKIHSKSKNKNSNKIKFQPENLNLNPYSAALRKFFQKKEPNFHFIIQQENDSNKENYRKTLSLGSKKYSQKEMNSIHCTLEFQEWMWWFQKENEMKPLENYLLRHPNLNKSHRQVLIEWLSEVCMENFLQTETFFLCVSIFDRIMSLEKNVNISLLQLHGTAALSLAAKFQEINSPTLEKLADLTLGACNPAALAKMELYILHRLSWNLLTPTPASWLLSCLQSSIGESTFKMEKVQQAKFKLPRKILNHYKKGIELLTLSTLYNESCYYPTSIIAFSAFELTKNHAQRQNISPQDWYEKKTVECCKMWLATILPYVQENSEPIMEDLLHRHPKNMLELTENY